MVSKIILMRPNSSGLNLLGFSNLLDAMASAVSGDNICIQAPGTYDLGSNSLTLKNGVNIDAVPGVIITSSNATATITDGGNTVVCIISSNIKVTNSNGTNYLFSRTGIGSNFGYKWKWAYCVKQTGINAPVVDTTNEPFDNFLGFPTTFVYQEAGYYYLTLFNISKSFITELCMNGISQDGKYTYPITWANNRFFRIEIPVSNISITTYDTSGNFADVWQAYVKIAGII